MVRRVKAGVVFGIPLGSKLVGTGIVLHVSRYFVGSIMVAFYRQAFVSIDQIEMGELRGDFVEMPNYTTRRVLTTGRWIVVGNSPDLLNQAVIPELRAARTLFHKDEVVRHIPLNEIFHYPEVLGQNVFSLEDRLRKYYQQIE